MEPEILISITMRLPQSDRQALAAHLAPVINEAIVAGGDTVHVSLQPYDPDEEVRRTKTRSIFFQILGRMKFADYNRRGKSI